MYESLPFHIAFHVSAIVIALAMAAMFAYYAKALRRVHLRLWSLSFVAAALHFTIGFAAYSLTPGTPVTALVHGASLLTAYWQFVLLLAGARPVWRGSGRGAAAIATGLLAAAVLAVGITAWRIWTVGMLNLPAIAHDSAGGYLTGIAFIALGITIFRNRNGDARTPHVGALLTALACIAHGGLLGSIAALRWADAYWPGAAAWSEALHWQEPLGMLLLGFGMVIWLLEEERFRAERATERVEHLRHLDALTGLPNRKGLFEVLRPLLASNEPVLVLQIRIDNIGQVAAAFGTHGVEYALIASATRMADVARGHDLFAVRLDGNHFIVVGKQPDMRGISTLAEQLLARIGQPIECDGQMFSVEASIGIALGPRDGTNAKVLLSHSEVARARAREEGSTLYRYYAPDLNIAAGQRLALHSALRQAFERDEFTLVFQPIVSRHNHAIVAFEALLRWRNVQAESIPPEEYIAEMEPLGLMQKLDAWVLERACTRALAWQAPGRSVAVAVNVSASSFQDPSFPEQVRNLLARTRLPPHCLELEIVESIAVGEPRQALLNLGSLRQIGVQVSLDDFGTGYSSLKHLRQLPIDTIKIDRSFVIDVLVDARDAAIVHAIIRLAHSLGMTVVAEGIETPAQLAWFEAHNCDRLQGFHFHEPLEPDAALALLSPAPLVTVDPAIRPRPL